MLPILFTTPFFVLRTLTVFSVIAYLVSLFFYWKKGKEEHYDEAVMFDGFLLSSIVGLIVGRISFVILNFSSFSSALLSWFDIWNHPGSLFEVGLIAAGLYLARFAKNQKWDVFEILDFWSIAVAAGLAILNIAYFLDGSQFGTATTLPWGVTFEGLLEPHHPTQLYRFIFFSVLVWYLSWVELRYRTYEWYRVGKRNAQTGFLIAMFLIMLGVFNLLLSPISLETSNFFGISMLSISSALSATVGAMIMVSRSGRFQNFKVRK